MNTKIYHTSVPRKATTTLYKAPFPFFYKTSLHTEPRYVYDNHVSYKGMGKKVTLKPESENGDQTQEIGSSIE